MQDTPHPKANKSNCGVYGQIKTFIIFLYNNKIHLHRNQKARNYSNNTKVNVTSG